MESKNNVRLKNANDLKGIKKISKSVVLKNVDKSNITQNSVKLTKSHTKETDLKNKNRNPTVLRDSIAKNISNLCDSSNKRDLTSHPLVNN